MDHALGCTLTQPLAPPTRENAQRRYLAHGVNLGAVSLGTRAKEVLDGVGDVGGVKAACLLGFALGLKFPRHAVPLQPIFLELELVAILKLGLGHVVLQLGGLELGLHLRQVLLETRLNALDLLRRAVVILVVAWLRFDAPALHGSLQVHGGGEETQGHGHVRKDAIRGLPLDPKDGAEQFARRRLRLLDVGGHHPVHALQRLHEAEQFANLLLVVPAVGW